jgi:hypothetical protein
MFSLGYTDQDQARRWIARAGTVCLGAGALLLSGCMGSVRDARAASATGPGKASLQVASTEKDKSGAEVGHASLGGSRLAAGQRGVNQQVAGRGQRGGRGGAIPARPYVPNPPPPPAIAVEQNRIPLPQKQLVAAAAPKPATAKQPVRTEPRATAAKARPAANSAATRTAVAEVAAKKRTDSRSITQASARVAADGQRPFPPLITPNGSTAADVAADADRERSDRLMERARLMHRHDFNEEALRLATVAEQLERSHRVTYRSDELRPSELVAMIQEALQANATDEAGDDPALLAGQRRTYRNRSTPIDAASIPAVRGNVELTDIRAGWQAIAEKPSEAGGNQIALAHGGENVASAAQTAAYQSTRRVAAGKSSAHRLANQYDAQPPDASTEADAGLEANSTTARSGWTFSSIVGIVAGIGGLFGLAYWRRQERKHYAAAAR